MITTYNSNTASNRHTAPNKHTAQWLREFVLPKEWRSQLPTLYRLSQGFNFNIIQCLDPLSLCGERTFSLGCMQDGSCTLDKFILLTPSFVSIRKLEKYAEKYAVEILHFHFYSQDNQSLTALGA